MILTDNLSRAIFLPTDRIRHSYLKYPFFYFRFKKFSILYFNYLNYDRNINWRIYELHLPLGYRFKLKQCWLVLSEHNSFILGILYLKIINEDGHRSYSHFSSFSSKGLVGKSPIHQDLSCVQIIHELTCSFNL